MPQLHRSSPSTATRSEEKRRNLLITASELFLQQGYDGLSVDAIVAAAGGSKATIYRYFGSKADLLVAVVEYLCEDFIINLKQLDTSGVELTRGLELILEELVAVVTSPRHVDFYRLVVNGSAHVPQVGQTWYEHGPQVWHQLIFNLLEEQRHRGLIAANSSFSELPPILFDALFSHLTTRTVMLGQTCTAKAFAPMINELIALVVRRLKAP